jgi:uncharacterized protein YbjT (DUF2867 family)
MAKKIIAVTGATGAQGGALVRAILADPAGGYTVRAVTRHPNGDQGRALATQGAEVVGADLDHRASLETAFRGAYGVYCVTNFWEHMSVEREIAQARNMATAAKAAGVEHAIWSTLEDTRLKVPLQDDRMPTLHGKYKVPHFDGKGEANRAFTDIGVPTTLFHTSFYWDNFISFGMGPKRQPDGRLVLALPLGDKRLAGIAAEDIGKCAYGVFKRGAELRGKAIGIAGDHLTGAQMATAFSRALEREVVYQYVPPEVYRTLGFPGADDLGNMFQYYRDFDEEFCGSRDLAFSRSLNPELQTFATWLGRNRSRIPVG